MKRLLYALAGLAVLAGAGAVAFSLAFGPAVKAAVEALGPRVAGAPMSLRSFTFSPFTGGVRLRGLVVGNPPGYKTPNAMELGDVRVRVRLRSLLSDTIVVEHVIVRKAEATYEFGPGGSNVAVIQKNAAAFAGGGASSGGGPSKRILIKDFRFEDGRARLSAPFLAGKAVDVAIPDIRLKNVGGDKGVTPAQAAAEMIRAVSSAVAGAGLEGLKGAGDGALKAADKAFTGFKKLFK